MYRYWRSLPLGTEVAKLRLNDLSFLSLFLPIILYFVFTLGLSLNPVELLSALHKLTGKNIILYFRSDAINNGPVFCKAL